MAKYHVLADAVCWSERDEFTKAPQHCSAKQGEEVEIPDEHVARFAGLTERFGHPLIGTKDDYEAWVNKPGLPTGPTAKLTDAQIGQLTGEQVLSHLNQTNADAERILDLEGSRARPRKSVIEAAEALIAARETAAADAERQAASAAQ